MNFRRPDHTIDETQRGSTARYYKRRFWYRHDERPGQTAKGVLEILAGHRRGGHGWGIVFGRNGGESDIGLDIDAGRILSVWARLQAPWTHRFRDPDNYNAWHYGIRIRPHGMAWVQIEWRHDPMGDKAGSWSMNKHTFLGRIRSEKHVIDIGTCRIPMPEGVYPATWEKMRYVSHYVGPLGKFRDRILGPCTSDPSFWIDVPGGIPVEGKGENSWDCGMDGIFGTGGRTLHDAIGNVSAAAMRDRDRYGGPHNLSRPMTVTEAREATER